MKCPSSMPSGPTSTEAEQVCPAGAAGLSQPGAELALGVPNCSRSASGDVTVDTVETVDSTPLCREPERLQAQAETREVQTG